MGSIFKIIKKDLSLGNLLSNIVINIIFTFLLFLFFYMGYSSKIINHEFILGNDFMFANIIGFMMIIFSFLKAMFGYDELLNNNGCLINLKTAGIFENSIFFGKTLSIWLQSIITILVSLLTIILFSGYMPAPLNLLYLILFLMLSSLTVIQIVGFLKYILKPNKINEMYIFYIFILLMLCSGFIFPFSLFSGPIYYLIKYLPFSIIMEGGRKMLDINGFSFIELLYVSILTITLLITNYLLFKKELLK